MKYAPLFLLPLILAFAYAVSPAAARELPRSQKTGKLVGHVEIGPLTPVEHPGQKPKPSPEMYKKYTVMVTQRGPQNGQMKSMLMRVVARAKLSATGGFSIDLAPGKYQVGVESLPEALRHPNQQEIAITAGKTTKVTIHVDTGIR